LVVHRAYSKVSQFKFIIPDKLQKPLHLIQSGFWFNNTLVGLEEYNLLKQKRAFELLQLSRVKFFTF